MNPDNLTDEELRQWIAQKRGWKECAERHNKNTGETLFNGKAPNGCWMDIPEYLNSLDAMNEAMPALSADLQKEKFMNRLAELCEDSLPETCRTGHAMWALIHATARQRAQAFYLATK